MSGGAFDYQQYQIHMIADQIQEVIDKNEEEWSPGTLFHMKDGVNLLRRAAVYAHRIDWLLSGDDGEDDFVERMIWDLEKLHKGELE